MGRRRCARSLIAAGAVVATLAFGASQAVGGGSPFDPPAGPGPGVGPMAVPPALPVVPNVIDANHTLVVDDDHAQCPNAPYQTIQAAVDAAQPGDAVKVCPGTYAEQVRIETSNLTLYSSVPLGAVIQAPPVMTQPNSIVLVRNARNVVLLRFTITGPYTFSGCAEALDRHTGVRVIDGSAAIAGNHITQIRDVLPALRGCQDGIGVLVGRNLEGQVGLAAILYNLIDLYQKGGIVVDNAGSYAGVSANEIDGDTTLSSLIAQNGVQVGRGAGAQVDHNLIVDNFYCCNLAGDTAAGVLLFETSANVVVRENDVRRNGVGIDVDEGAVGLLIKGNSVRKSHNSGLLAYIGSSHNRFERNTAFDNVPYDCEDDTNGSGTAGTDNVWVHNQGDTQNRPGLCKPGH